MVLVKSTCALTMHHILRQETQRVTHECAKTQSNKLQRQINDGHSDRQFNLGSTHSRLQTQHEGDRPQYHASVRDTSARIHHAEPENKDPEYSERARALIRCARTNQRVMSMKNISIPLGTLEGIMRLKITIALCANFTKRSTQIFYCTPARSARSVATLAS